MFPHQIRFQILAFFICLFLTDHLFFFLLFAKNIINIVLLELFIEQWLTASIDVEFKEVQRGEWGIMGAVRRGGWCLNRVVEKGVHGVGEANIMSSEGVGGGRMLTSIVGHGNFVTFIDVIRNSTKSYLR